MDTVVVKLRDSQGSFFDASQNRGVAGKAVVVLRLTDKVRVAIRAKALLSIPEKGAAKELKKFLKSSEDAVIESNKSLKSVHEKFKKKEGEDKAAKRVAKIKNANKVMLERIEDDIKSIVGEDEVVVIPEGNPSKDWTIPEIKEWLKKNEVKFGANSKEETLLKKVEEHLAK